MSVIVQHRQARQRRRLWGRGRRRGWLHRYSRYEICQCGSFFYLDLHFGLLKINKWFKMFRGWLHMQSKKEICEKKIHHRNSCIKWSAARCLNLGLFVLEWVAFCLKKKYAMTNKFHHRLWRISFLLADEVENCCSLSICKNQQHSQLTVT